MPARGIYSLAVVVWLMMWQRLDSRGSLATAVQQVVQGALGDLVPPDKRVREQRVSSNTGALSRAQKRLPGMAVEAVCDEIFSGLMEPAEASGGLQSRLFLVDGSSMRLAHTAALKKAYPLGSNQHGEAHWPVIRVLVAHHLSSGLAVRACWGPMYGDEAVSEQGLTEQMLGRLPPGSALMADRNFAVFSVAWAAQQHHCGVLLRITEARARKIAGPFLPPAGSERQIEWRPSREDRRAHPELPVEAVVRGRLIVAHVQGEDGKTLKLYLVYPPGRAAGSVGGVVSATVGYRVGHSVSEADFGNAQPPFEDTGDGEKGTIAGHRRVQFGAQCTDGGGSTGEFGATTAEFLKSSGGDHDCLTAISNDH